MKLEDLVGPHKLSGVGQQPQTEYYDSAACQDLRQAALEWAKASVDMPVTAKDEAFKKVDAKLMKAAVKYAESLE